MAGNGLRTEVSLGVPTTVTASSSSFGDSGSPVGLSTKASSKRRSMMIRRQQPTQQQPTSALHPDDVHNPASPSVSTNVETRTQVSQGDARVSSPDPNASVTPPLSPCKPSFKVTTPQSSTPQPPQPLPSGFTSTQASSTSLPDELLDLIREFRVRTERVAAQVAGGDAGGLIQQLHHSGNDIIRYVTNFLIQKHEEEVRYEQRKLMGWAAASSGVSDGGSAPRLNSPTGNRIDPSILGPFVLTTLYGIMENMLHTLKCDRGRIFLPDGPDLLAVVTVGGGAIVAPVKADWTRIAGSVYRIGVALNVGDTSKAPPQFSCSANDARHGYHVRSVLSFPLVVPSDDDAFKVASSKDKDPSAGEVPKRPQRVLGVVEFMNKHRSAAFASGFTEEDEAAAHHVADLIVSLLVWSTPVDLCNNTSLEEGFKLQALVMSQRHHGAHLRTQTSAGAQAITRSEAASLIRKQQQKEAAHKTKQDAALVVDHPFLHKAERLHHQHTTLMYRIACKSAAESIVAKSEPTSYISSEAHALIQSNGNIRELVQMLEQLDASWKTARQRCVALEDRVAVLEAELRCEQGTTRALRQLCVSCGITPPPAQTSHQFEAMHMHGTTEVPAFIEQAGLSLVEAGSVDATVDALHQNVKDRLKFAASKASNLGRRISDTARAEFGAAHRAKTPPKRPVPPSIKKVVTSVEERKATVDALLVKLERQSTRH